MTRTIKVAPSDASDAPNGKNRHQNFEASIRAAVDYSVFELNTAANEYDQPNKLPPAVRLVRSPN
jgi:hypothetical protein